MKIYKMLSNFKLLPSMPCFLKRNISSVLYITGDKAQNTFALLTPVIDFEKQLDSEDVLKQNIKARTLPIDIEKIKKGWQFFQSIDDQKKNLELTRIEIGKLISELMKDADQNKEEIEKLKLHSRLIKEDLKNVKDFYYGLEEDTMLKLLSLPNVLHNKTPLESVTVHSFSEIAKDKKSNSHMEIGEHNGFIEYINPFVCYLKSDAARFELCILNHFTKHLLNLNYTQFSNPNFCRSVIVEGCGTNYEEISKVFIIEEQDESKDVNHLHLCGAASLYPFVSYFTKHSVQQTKFPLKYFSLGKNYQPIDSKLPKNLFNLSQESAVNIFVATLEEEDILEEITKEVITLYESLGYHFRLIYLPASDLDKSESLRLSVQMFSNYLESYVEVGNISLYENYLSKRLLFTYNDVNKERKYPKIIAGTLLNVPKMLGCLLENNSVSNKDLLSNELKKYMFI